MTIDESTPAGAPLLIVNATDMDSGRNAVINYTMPLMVAGYHIDPITGTGLMTYSNLLQNHNCDGVDLEYYILTVYYF